ncbi:hypothetical protein H4219_006260 [Mycoemilia scoparia]|uniref:Uncharacterized protein n=1 Tax=Mycoemilia scoparia TaxID=417184 RepID=A0A9W7ZS45_9FUNG|nr:hypothetical protein H4219_006260 [Mycoemilia scoparia]
MSNAMDFFKPPPRSLSKDNHRLRIEFYRFALNNNSIEHFVQYFRVLSLLLDEKLIWYGLSQVTINFYIQKLMVIEKGLTYCANDNLVWGSSNLPMVLKIGKALLRYVKIRIRYYEKHEKNKPQDAIWGVVLGAADNGGSNNKNSEPILGMIFCLWVLRQGAVHIVVAFILSKQSGLLVEQVPLDYAGLLIETNESAKWLIEYLGTKAHLQPVSPPTSSEPSNLFGTLGQCHSNNHTVGQQDELEKMINSLLIYVDERPVFLDTLLNNTIICLQNVIGNSSFLEYPKFGSHIDLIDSYLDSIKPQSSNDRGNESFGTLILFL